MAVLARMSCVRGIHQFSTQEAVYRSIELGGLRCGGPSCLARTTAVELGAAAGAARRGAGQLQPETLEPRRLLAGLPLPADLVAEGEAEIVFQTDFESGTAGFTVDNTGGRNAGMWHYSVGRRRDNLPNHTPDSSFYYGLFETATGGGRYDLSLSHQGLLTSPEISLPACGESSVSFNYLLDTRTPLDLDYVELRIDNGVNVDVVLSRADGTLPETGNAWRTAVADLSNYAGQTIQLVFSFDTGEDVFIDPEGWYVDDILVAATECQGSVTGLKFNDVNQDNERQDDEPIVSGVVMTLTGDTDGDGFVETLNAITDGDGRYQFA